jgi:hypothetical protein
MRETNDGFRIAEEDLRLRGAGECSARASPASSASLATPEQIQALIADAAHADARLLIDRDGGLKSERGEAARTCLYLFERDAARRLHCQASSYSEVRRPTSRLLGIRVSTNMAKRCPLGTMP